VGWKNPVLWVLQVFLGVYFISIGVVHFVLPADLPSMMEWMYELNDNAHIFIGIVEILGGLGLILPSVTRIRPELTVYAATGLVIVMASALVWHASRSEGSQIGTNVLIAALLAFIAYGRWKLAPITAKDS
jgi:putative oxidoreductase